MLDSYNDRVKY